MRMVIVLAGIVVVLAATLVRLVEPHTFKSFGLALWWAVVTVGTVGYGDIVPHSTAGRLVASVTILFSMAMIPTITSLVVAILIAKLGEERGTDQMARLDEISARLAALERQLDGTRPSSTDRGA